MRRKATILILAILVACSGRVRSPDEAKESKPSRLFITQETSQIVLYAASVTRIGLPLDWHIRKIALNRADGTQTDLVGSRTTLRLNGLKEGQKLLTVSEVKAGEYSGITIFTQDLTSELTGEFVPMDKQVVSLEHSFSVVAGNSKTLTLILDLAHVGDLEQITTFRPGFFIQDENSTPSGRLIYVANELSSSISVIDRDSKEVVYNVFVGTQPYTLAADQRRKRLYIGDRKDGVLYEMNMVSNSLTRATEIDFVDEPVHIEPIPSKDIFLVLNYGSHSVHIMDSFSGHIRETIDVSENPVDAVYSSLYDLAFVLSKRWGMLTVLDMSSEPVDVDTVIRVEREPVGLALDDTEEWLFISSSGSIDFTVFEIRRMAVERTVTIGLGAADIAFDPLGRRLYIAMLDTHEILCLDPFTGVMAFRIGLPARPGRLFFEADEKRLYVAVPEKNAVAVIDPMSQRIHDWIETGLRPSSITMRL